MKLTKLNYSFDQKVLQMTEVIHSVNGYGSLWSLFATH